MAARAMLYTGSVCAVAKAIERAQTALANAANMSDEEASALEAGLKRNLAMLGVKRRRRSV
jgi:hypothetical protein